MCSFLKLQGVQYHADKLTQPHLRHMCGNVPPDYTISRVEQSIGANSHCIVTKKTYKWPYKPQLVRPEITNEKVIELLDGYDELAFDQLPYWLRETVKARGIVFKQHQPDQVAMWDTVDDAREHRIMNNELTIQDFIDKYTKRQSLSIFT